MTLYKPPPVSDEPNIVLQHWSVYEVPIPGFAPTRHFVGYNPVTADGRVSSPIVEWDAAKHEGVTRSGRVYKLDGHAGATTDSEYVFGVWLRHNGVTEPIKDVTGEYA